MAIQAPAGYLTRDTISVTTIPAVVAGAGGFAIRPKPTPAARQPLPSNVPCRMQEMDLDEITKYGLHGTDRYFKILCGLNPQLRINDYVSFTDIDGVVHSDMRLVKPSRNVDNQGQFYVAVCEELQARQSSVPTAP